jgi:hypothetical protein
MAELGRIDDHQSRIGNKPLSFKTLLAKRRTLTRTLAALTRMWKSSWYNHPLRHLRDKDDKDNMLPQDDQGVPDLLADNNHLSSIGSVRDSVRSLFRAARLYDERNTGVEETCFGDVQRFLIFFCSG